MAADVIEEYNRRHDNQTENQPVRPSTLRNEADRIAGSESQNN